MDFSDDSDHSEDEIQVMPYMHEPMAEIYSQETEPSGEIDSDDSPDDLKFGNV